MAYIRGSTNERNKFVKEGGKKSMKLLYSVGLVFFHSCKNNSTYAQWQFIAFQQMQLHSLLLSNF